MLARRDAAHQRERPLAGLDLDLPAVEALPAELDIDHLDPAVVYQRRSGDHDPGELAGQQHLSLDTVPQAQQIQPRRTSRITGTVPAPAATSGARETRSTSPPGMRTGSSPAHRSVTRPADACESADAWSGCSAS